jgi:predicted HTH domain antitoxin
MQNTNKQTVTLNLPENVSWVLQSPDIKLEQDVRIALGMKYYLDQRISIGKAAELAGMDRIDFETYLSEHQVPISLLTYDDVMKDVDNMKDLNMATA